MSGAVAGEVALTVDGLVHRGWRSAKVSMGLDAAAAEIAIELAERWSDAPDGEQIVRAVRPGAPFTLALDDDVVVEGHIDALEIRYDHRSHDLTIRGREKTGDLVDSAATVDGPYEWARIGLEEAARRICQPFGIRVKTEGAVPATPFPRFSLQPGETAWEAIARAARERAVIVTGDGRGTLLLTRAGEGGEAAGALRLGGADGNIRSAEGTFDFTKRHSVVVLRGQAEGSTAGAEGQARATDPDVTRHRPRVVLAEAQGEGGSLQDRATHEVRLAAGRSRRVRYTVPGWRGAGGALWRPNTRAMVEDRYLGLARELLVANVTYSLTPDEGTLTELDLAPVDAYALLPEQPRRRGGDRPDTPFETRIEESRDGGRTWQRIRETPA